VSGYALPPIADKVVYIAAGVERRLHSVIGDITDAKALNAAMREAAPEIVFHLAAQALVRRSVADPVGTYKTNVMGTVNVLEAVRDQSQVKSVIVVTSDKCYENRESDRRYRETDPLGGDNPYSNSKVCAEFVTLAYRRTYFNSGARVATARASNVIGGGDWSEDRLIPDLVRGVLNHTPTTIRNPDAVRPWQHVLEPIVGYLGLAEHMARSTARVPNELNFGPDTEGEQSVAHLADVFCRLWGKGASWRHVADAAIQEAQQLRLDSALARRTIGWKPRWSFDRAVEAAVEWYRVMADEKDLGAITERQIDQYLTGHTR
jgi:CDP-glucose 4,6-dehydratase